MFYCISKVPCAELSRGNTCLFHRRGSPSFDYRRLRLSVRMQNTAAAAASTRGCLFAPSRNHATAAASAVSRVTFTPRPECEHVSTQVARRYVSAECLCAVRPGSEVLVGCGRRALSPSRVWHGQLPQLSGNNNSREGDHCRERTTAERKRRWSRIWERVAVPQKNMDTLCHACCSTGHNPDMLNIDLDYNRNIRATC